MMNTEYKFPPKPPRDKNRLHQVVDRAQHVVWVWDPIAWGIMRQGWGRLNEQQAEVLLRDK